MTAEEETRVRAHLRECEKCAQRDAKLVARLDDQVRQVRKWRVDGGGDATATQSLEAPRDESPSPSIHIEGYDIIRVLGDGGQGVVYQAVQLSTKRKVAIKVLREGPHASESSRRRFEREIEVVAQLKHHNIIPIFHSGKTPDGHDYCVMDYIRGVPLNHYVRDTKPTLEESLALFSKVCIAVNYAHQKGVIHRDLKPSNILVDAEGEPKLLDFGLAKMVSGPVETLVSITGQVVGTLPYMSPEQTRGNPDEIDIRTDVYALGVMFYESLTGHYPYPVVGEMAEVFKHITDTEPTPPSRQWTADSGVTKRATRSLRAGQCPIDDDLQTIILKTLSKQRDRRYQTAGELAKDFGHYLAGEPIEAKRDSGWYVLRKSLVRHKVAALVASAFALVIAASVTVFLIMYGLNQAQHDLIVQANELISEGQVLIKNRNHDAAAQKFDGAKHLFDEVLRQDPSNANATQGKQEAEEARLLIDEGIVLEQEGRHPEAYAKYTQALDLGDSFRAMFYRARWLKDDYFRAEFAFRDRGNLEEAMRLCDEAIRITPDVHQLWNLKSVLMYSFGRLDEAEHAARRTLELNPDYFYAGEQLAKILALQHRFEDAINESSVLAELAAEKGQLKFREYTDGIWRALGTVQLLLGRESALVSLETAREVDATDQRTTLMLARLHLTLPGHIDIKRALEIATLAKQSTELHDPRFDRVLAQAYLATKDFPAAARHAESAFTKHDQPASYSHLIAVIAYAYLKQWDDAKEHFDHATATWPEVFKAGEEVIVTCEKGMLWFDTLSELEALRMEAEQLLSAADRGSKP